MKITFIALISILTTQGAWASCTDFFYVKRPVVYGTVIHEFIIAENQESKSAEAFGLLKGNEDLRIFLEARKSGDESLAEIDIIGTACDSKAAEATQMARYYSKVWSQTYENWILYLSRMGITPVIGKPCRNAALELAEDLRPYLN